MCVCECVCGVCVCSVNVLVLVCVCVCLGAVPLCKFLSACQLTCVCVRVCVMCVSVCVICVLYRPWQQNVCLSCTHLYQLEYTCVCVCVCVSAGWLWVLVIFKRVSLAVVKAQKRKQPKVFKA